MIDPMGSRREPNEERQISEETDPGDRGGFYANGQSALRWGQYPWWAEIGSWVGDGGVATLL
jgi:hypothetical protein